MSTQPDPRCFTRVGATDKQWVKQWKEGDRVEVYSMSDSRGNYRFTFSPGVVREVKGGQLLVAYDKGEKLTEWFDVLDKHLRPALPAVLYPQGFAGYKVGKTVDVLKDDIWRWGVVAEVMPHAVCVTCPGGDHVVTEPSKLRLGCEWLSFFWKRRVPNKSLLDGHLHPNEVEKMSKDLRRAPLLTEDGSPAPPAPKVQLRKALEDHQKLYKEESQLVDARRRQAEIEEEAEEDRQAWHIAEWWEQDLRAAAHTTNTTSIVVTPEMLEAVQWPAIERAEACAEKAGMHPAAAQQLPDIVRQYKQSPQLLLQLIKAFAMPLFLQCTENPSIILRLISDDAQLKAVVSRLLTLANQVYTHNLLCHKFISEGLLKLQKEVRRFDALPQLAISTIHDILMQSSADKDGFHTQPRDAGDFCCACKAFNDAVIMPHTLKLTFTEPPGLVTCKSLATMLSRPRAARTQLSLRLRIDPDSEALHCKKTHLWADPLSALSTKVLWLEMPAVSINTTFGAACKALPGLQELVLHIDQFSETGIFPDAPGPDIRFSDEEEEEATYARVFAWLPASQLRSLTLSVPPGEIPFIFSSSDPPLDLTDMPAFQHLRLLGPIVRSSVRHLDEFDELIWVPPCTKVTIDPGLKGRKPTRWARPVTE